jgi:hypothetical protein
MNNRGEARPRAGRRSAWLLTGSLAAIAYLAAVAGTGPWVLPTRLLYDGYTPPPPYRWVHPPDAVARGNQPPQSGSGVAELTPSGSAPASIATGDEQAVLVVPRGAIAPRQGEPSVEFRIDPLDPATVGPPPTGLRYDSNAYRVTATYTVSHQPAPLIAPVNIVLRYATNATTIAHSARSSWVPLSPSTLPITFQIYGPTNDLGTFVAAAPPPHGPPVAVWAYRIVTVLLWLVAAAIAGMLVRDYAHRRRRRRAA